MREIREISLEKRPPEEDTYNLRGIYGEHTVFTASGELHRRELNNEFTFHGKINSGPKDWIGKGVVIRIGKNKNGTLQFNGVI